MKAAGQHLHYDDHAAPQAMLSLKQHIKEQYIKTLFRVHNLWFVSGLILYNGLTHAKNFYILYYIETMIKEKAVIPAEMALPAKLVILPLTSRPIFPGLFIPMILQDKDDMRVVAHAIRQGSMLGLVLTDEEENSTSGIENIHSIGTVAKNRKTHTATEWGFEYIYLDSQALSHQEVFAPNRTFCGCGGVFGKMTIPPAMRTR